MKEIDKEGVEWLVEMDVLQPNLETRIMKTAVEWLYEEFTKTNHLTEDEFYMKFQQAKEMEKERIINATLYGFRQDSDGDDWEGDKHNAEKYYNETFKQQEQ
jgi:hypothetical protein